MEPIHLINRLRYTITCEDESQAFEVRPVLASMATEELAGIMDDLCNRYLKKEEWIRIPRMEIDLGNLSIHTLRSKAIEAFANAFEAQLSAQIGQHSPEERTTARSANEHEACFFFLEHGYLPGWYFLPAQTPMDLLDRLLADHPVWLKKWLDAQVNNQVVWQRLVLQADFAAKTKIRHLFPALVTAYDLLIAHFEAPAINAESNGFVSPPSNPIYVTEQWLTDVVLWHAAQWLSAHQPFDELITPIVHQLDQVLSYLKKDNQSIPELILLMHQNKNEKRVSPPILIDQQTVNSGDNESHSGFDEKIGIHCAGIVLLNPFLKHFFTQLNLMDSDGWKDTGCRHRAVHLLHYLSSGKQDQPEWNLVFEKMICGVLPGQPVGRNIPLNQEELAECDSLLFAVIEHWQALKSTSVAGLQDAFLRRDGLLQRTDQGWHVFVERKTQDILLETLPWSYTMLQFSWNDYLIDVAWL